MDFLTYWCTRSTAGCVRPQSNLSSWRWLFRPLHRVVVESGTASETNESVAEHSLAQPAVAVDDWHNSGGSFVGRPLERPGHRSTWQAPLLRKTALLGHATLILRPPVSLCYMRADWRCPSRRCIASEPHIFQWRFLLRLGQTKLQQGSGGSCIHTPRSSRTSCWTVRRSFK